MEVGIFTNISPAKGIGGVRMQFFTKVIISRGGKVICDNHKDSLVDYFTTEELSNIYYSRLLTKGSDVSVARNKKLLLLYKAFRNSILFGPLLEYNGFKRLQFKINTLLKIASPNDILISSYGPLNDNFAVLIYKIFKGKSNPWIQDYRDLIYYQGSVRSITHCIDKYLLKKLYLSNADYILGVSNGILEGIIVQNHYNTQVIYNGFLQSNNEEVVSCDTVNTIINDESLFLIVYAGALYDGRRDPKDLIRKIRTFIETNDNVRLVYLGKDRHLWIDACSKLDIDSQKVIAFDTVSRECALKLQQRADINVLITWCNDSEKGILTGKLFDIIMMNKPIIAFVNGLFDYELEDLFNRYEIGFVCSSITPQCDIDLYLMQCRTRTADTAVTKAFRRFDYLNRYGELEKVFKKLA